jgi:hypothetical protein
MIPAFTSAFQCLNFDFIIVCTVNWILNNDKNFHTHFYLEPNPENIVVEPNPKKIFRIHYNHLSLIKKCYHKVDSVDSNEKNF